MLRMAVGHSDDVDVESALAAVFAECDAQLQGMPPSAGLLFLADVIDQRAVIEAIRDRYGEIELAGSTSVGEMSSVRGYEEDSIALALFAADGVEFSVGVGTGVGIDADAAVDAAVAEARAKTAAEPRLCIVFLTVPTVEPSVVLGRLRYRLGPGVPVLGGGAAPAVGMTHDPRPRAIANDQILEDGIVVLLLSGSLAFSFGVDTGWRPVGARGTVTRATARTVEEIDGRPAIEFFERYLGQGDPPIGNPLAVFEDDSDRFYLRTPISTERPGGAIRVFGAIPEGSTVQLTVAATEEIFEGTRSALSTALSRYPSGARPDAGLVFSCAVRKWILGTRTRREIEMTRELLGEGVPIAGFYCAGELAPLDDPSVTRFHNETIVAVLLGSA
jgi:hypothetical protein